MYRVFAALFTVAAVAPAAVAGSQAPAPKIVTGLPSVSPDGRRIAYALMDTARKLQVWVMNAEGTGARQVTC